MSKKNPLALVAHQLNTTRMRASTASFTGADQSRLMADWLVGNLSTDAEVRANIRLLRARARDLVKNNPWCVGFIDELKNNVVGEVGIMLQARVKTQARGAVKPKLASATNKEIERAWKEWGHHETASASRRLSLVDLEDLAIETIATDGEAFVRRLDGFDNDFGYALQFVDADLVDENFNRPRGAGVNEIRMGVELDSFGAEVGFHVWNRYSSDNTGVPRRHVFYSVAEMLHLFVPFRPNQTRGITWFAPILTSVRHLDGYETNELVATRASAAKMGFIVNKSPEAISSFEPPKKGAGPKKMDTQPGLITELFPGQEFQTFDPTHPSTAYEMFTSTVLRAIARGLKVSYLTLTGDLRQANYSSMRAGLLPERDRWRKLHGWMAEHFCRPV
jgi:lambda family phage portal protein